MRRIREPRARNNHARQRHSDADIGAVILPAHESREQSSECGGGKHGERDAAKREMRVVPGDSHGRRGRTERGIEQRVSATELLTTPARRGGCRARQDEGDGGEGTAPGIAERLNGTSQRPRGRAGRQENRHGQRGTDEPGPP